MNSFLDKLNLNFVESTAVVDNKRGRKVSIERTPEDGIRLFKDGSVWPSKKYVDQFNLQYQADGSGNGFDVFLSHDWYLINKETSPNVVLAALVPKSEPKVDLFGSFRKRLDNTVTDVMEQGSKTFGEEFIAMLMKANGTVLTEDLFGSNDYVDVIFVGEVDNVPNGIYKLPKGAKREGGSAGTVKRSKDTVIYVVDLAHNIQQQMEDDIVNAAEANAVFSEEEEQTA